MIQCIENAYKKMENNQLAMHAKYLCYIRYSVVQKLNNKQSANVIYTFGKLRT